LRSLGLNFGVCEHATMDLQIMKLAIEGAVHAGAEA
jgi:hypothetical protein